MTHDFKIKNIQKLIVTTRVDAIFISNPYNIAYLTGYANFSTEERDAFLVITPKKSYLITDGRYSEAVTKVVPHFIVLERSLKNPMKLIFEKLVKKHQIVTLGIEEFDLRVAEYRSLKKFFHRVKGVDTSNIRKIKDPIEVKKIEAACGLSDQALNATLEQIKAGTTEKELSLYFESFLQKNGAKTSFETIIAFAKNASIPHHETGKTKLGSKKGQFILIDCGAKLDSYCSDMTRTVFWGKPTGKQLKMYETVLESQRLAAEFIDQSIKKGGKISGKEVDQIASEYIKSQGFEPYGHSLGHGVGLEVHESPTLSLRGTDTLEEGMVFSIEPGIYVPGFGGVRIEDLYVYEKRGVRELTKSSKKLLQL